MDSPGLVPLYAQVEGDYTDIVGRFQKVPDADFITEIAKAKEELLLLSVAIKICSDVAALSGQKVKLREAVSAQLASLKGGKVASTKLPPVLLARANDALKLR